MKRPRTSTLAAWGAAGSAAALLGAGAVSAGAATTAPAPSASAEAGDGTAERGEARPDRKAGLRDALHGEFVTGTEGSYVTQVAQRGEVTAVSATSITVASEDGFSQSYVVSGDTLVRVDGAEAEIADVTVGDPVRLGGTKDGSTVTAERIGAGDPPAREGRGGGHRGGHGPRGGEAPAEEGSDAGATVEGSSLTAS